MWSVPPDNVLTIAAVAARLRWFMRLALPTDVDKPAIFRLALLANPNSFTFFLGCSIALLSLRLFNLTVTASLVLVIVAFAAVLAYPSRSGWILGFDDRGVWIWVRCSRSLKPIRTSAAAHQNFPCVSVASGHSLLLSSRFMNGWTLALALRVPTGVESNAVSPTAL